MKRSLFRWLLFLACAVPLGYLVVAAQLEWGLLALLLLCLIYLVMRPFKLSVKGVTVIFVFYLAISGLLNFAQPLVKDSWPIFNAIALIAAFLQPLITLLAIDGILDTLDRSQRRYDMAAVVLLWVSTLAIVFGSMAFLHTNQNDLSLTFTLFLAPWAINGCIFLAAALVLSVALRGNRRLKSAVKKRTAKK